jgi:hypothetical protein
VQQDIEEVLAQIGGRDDWPTQMRPNVTPDGKEASHLPPPARFKWERAERERAKWGWARLSRNEASSAPGVPQECVEFTVPILSAWDTRRYSYGSLCTRV